MVQLLSSTLNNSLEEVDMVLVAEEMEIYVFFDVLLFGVDFCNDFILLFVACVP